MNIIKRWTAGVTSRVDWMVSQVENQEALVNSALRDARQSAARAKVQLGRVQQDGQRLRQRLQQEEQAVTTWRERAVQTSKQDENKALECLRRSKRAEQLAAQLQQRLSDHEQVEKQLGKDVRDMEEQLQGLTEKRNLMRTRQSRAEAVKSIQGSADAVSTDLDDIFERWETRVTEKEISGACSVNIDTLEDEFVSQEEDDALRDELKKLSGDG
ncbi:MAG: PspA/IM30 family protein [Desulfuromonadales bacterium]|nr:PspA/IM30 family protein [Desulfuromonadales bacterium]